MAPYLRLDEDKQAHTLAQSATQLTVGNPHLRALGLPLRPPCGALACFHALCAGSGAYVDVYMRPPFDVVEPDRTALAPDTAGDEEPYNGWLDEPSDDDDDDAEGDAGVDAEGGVEGAAWMDDGWDDAFQAAEQFDDGSGGNEDG